MFALPEFIWQEFPASKTFCDLTQDKAVGFQSSLDILFLEELVKLSLISSEDASDFIQLVENGNITLFEAYRLVKDILQEFDLDKGASRGKAA